MSPTGFWIAWLAVLSAVTFIAYGIDKRRAKKSEWRISEKTLLLLGAAGGAFGGLLGMKAFRHKTKRRYFWAANIAALIAHIAVAALLATGR